MNNNELIKLAIIAMKNAYAPYSKYMVGAALLSKSGRVYTGTNVENASFGCTNCAERTAFFKAVSEGEREFLKIAIVGCKKGEITDFATPCGVCRQVMSEFCDDNFEVIVALSEQDFKVFTLAQLLPFGFCKDNIDKV